MKKNYNKILVTPNRVKKLEVGVVLMSGILLAACSPTVHSRSSEKVAYYGAPTASISSGVIVPAGKKLHLTSGVTCPVADSTAAEGSRERFGDTKTQAIGILKTLQTTLSKNGLTFKDVIYLRVYLAPDPQQENKIDFKGWFDAYAQSFGTPENPTKPARSTLGVASLVNPDKLIEIELVAVYPD